MAHFNDNIDMFDDVQNVDDNFDDSEGDDEFIVIRAQKRYIRDALNPFEFYSEIEFHRRYRFTKDSVMYGILPTIVAGLEKPTKRGLPVSPVIQLLICLRYYSTASFQLVIGDVGGFSQPTISRIVLRITTLLASLINEYIKFPSTDEAKMENQRLFRAIGERNGLVGIPGVIGAIDCSHVRLVHTRFRNLDELYRNRKGYFSFNVQTIVGPRTEFLDIVPEWPGSMHDSRIFQNSRVFLRCSTGQLDGYLLGDAGYPCLPFLMTPSNNPTTEEEESYNVVHRTTRNVVERTYGIWKRRFPCLSRGLSTSVYCSSGIIVATAVLHNMSLIFRDILPDDNEEQLNNDNELPPIVPHFQPLEGHASRRALIGRMFNR